MTTTLALLHRLAAAFALAVGAALAVAAPITSSTPPPTTPAPAWTDAAGRPTRQAQDALATLADAASDGLDARDYRAAELAAAAAALQSAPTPDAARAFDFALDGALQRFLRELHAGSVDARSVGFRVPPRGQRPEAPAHTADARAAGRIADAVRDARPALPQYAALRALLARWRAIAADPDASTPLPAALPKKQKSIRPGDAWDGVPALRRRLAAWGDLARESAAEPPSPADALAAVNLYDGALVDAVQRFQQRHGLEADGAIGRSTLAALQVAPAQRVRQIELSLERLRWLPPLDGRTFVAINIPMFRLWVVDTAAAAGGNGAAAPLAMNVIVGRALNTQTPLLWDEMTHLIVRPYWNVPRSIVRNEILPALARDASYLARHEMEIVAGPGDDARPVAPSADAIAALREGKLRLRQRPGPKNSLGLIKFMFPNDDNVYMHDTPARQLFGRARRDFSHGCVRLERPLDLAQWVLRDQQPEWTRERIAEAMQGTRTLRIDLKQPLPVLLYYTTVIAPGDGSAGWFADDIYRHDARLERALAGRRAPQ